MWFQDQQAVTHKKEQLCEPIILGPVDLTGNFGEYYPFKNGNQTTFDDAMVKSLLEGMKKHIPVYGCGIIRKRHCETVSMTIKHKGNRGRPPCPMQIFPLPPGKLCRRGPAMPSGTCKSGCPIQGRTGCTGLSRKGMLAGCNRGAMSG